MGKKIFTLQEIKASLSKEKNAADSYWTQFILRPLSFPAAWLALRLGLSPNTVSWISALAAVLGGVFLALGNSALAWIGIALLFVFSVLDCADGNMARTMKKPNPWGSWTDAVGGYIAYTAALLGLGMAVEALQPSLFEGLGAVLPPGTWALIGGFAAASNMLMRASVQSHRLARLAQQTEGAVQVDTGSEKKLSENLGVTGILVPAYALGLATGTLSLVLIFYALLYGLGSIVLLAKLALSTRSKATRSSN